MSGKGFILLIKDSDLPNDCNPLRSSDGWYMNGNMDRLQKLVAVKFSTFF